MIEDYIPYLFSVDHCLDHGIFMLDKEIGIFQNKLRMTDKELLHGDVL